MGKGELGRGISCVKEVLAMCSRAALLSAACSGNAGHREEGLCVCVCKGGVWVYSHMAQPEGAGKM